MADKKPSDQPSQQVQGPTQQSPQTQEVKADLVALIRQLGDWAAYRSRCP